eukprot:7783007-Alexandrium_andersonii.AAC.1
MGARPSEASGGRDWQGGGRLMRRCPRAPRALGVHATWRASALHGTSCAQWAAHMWRTHIACGPWDILSCSGRARAYGRKQMPESAGADTRQFGG